MTKTIIKIWPPTKNRTSTHQKWRDETGQKYLTISNEYTVETQIYYANSAWKIVAPCDTNPGPPESHDETITKNGFVIVGEYEEN